MLAWLDKFFSGVASTIGQPISNAIHWAVHALAAVIFGVFGLVGKAWSGLVDGVRKFHAALDDYAAEIIKFATWVTRTAIPAIYKWATGELAKLSVALAGLGHDLTTLSVSLLARITSAIAGVTDWVITTVYDPLSAAVKLVAANLLKWGFTAYQYITHPQTLADLLIMPLITSLQNNAYAIARLIGDFIVTALRANAVKIAKLLEDIVTDVF
jgi:hypothetical protein